MQTHKSCANPTAHSHILQELLHHERPGLGGLVRPSACTQKQKQARPSRDTVSGGKEAPTRLETKPAFTHPQVSRSNSRARAAACPLP